MTRSVSFRGIVLGQLLSVALTITSTLSAILASDRYNLSAPFTQSAINYFLLFSAFGRPTEPWKNPCWKYALLGCLDCWSNWAVVKAFSLSSITSVTLLDSWTIPCVMILTWAMLGTRYGTRQLMGAGLCIIGLVALILSDRNTAGDGERSLAGDALVVAGATGYAVANVFQEKLLADTPSHEVLAALGGFGLLFSCVQIAAFERHALSAVTWSPPVVLYLLLFGVALFSFYVIVPHMLHESGSAVMNLSVLTSDFYTAGVRILFFGGFTPYAAASFALSSSLVVGGLALYVSSGLDSCRLEDADAESTRQDNLSDLERGQWLDSSDRNDNQPLLEHARSAECPSAGAQLQGALQVREHLETKTQADASRAPPRQHKQTNMDGASESLAIETAGQQIT